MDARDLIEACWTTQRPDDFSKTAFIKTIERMKDEQFNRFCKEVLFLRYFHDRNAGYFATEDEDLPVQYPEVFWKIKPINPDAGLPWDKSKANEQAKDQLFG